MKTHHRYRHALLQGEPKHVSSLLLKDLVIRDNAERGFDVLGVDVSPLAVEKPRAKMGGRALRCRFATLDFLTASPSDGPFEFVFDRGCFHVFDEPSESQRFAWQVAAVLAPGGLWLSLIGSTEGPQREVGPPRRSAREVMLAIEPALEIVELRSAAFREDAKAWFCLSRKRTVPARRPRDTIEAPAICA